MTSAPRLKAVDNPDDPRMSRLSQGESGTMIKAVSDPTAIEVTQDSPTTVPARDGFESLCSATYLEAVMLSPEVNRVVKRLVVASTMASSPKCVAPSNRAQITFAAIARPLANPAPAILQMAPVAIRRRREGSTRWNCAVRRDQYRPVRKPSGAFRSTSR